ncbi:MAG: restriction endonuclease [Planctomycetia bacterium]
MSIPDFQSLMLPLLRLLSDEREWAIRDLTRALEDEFALTEGERQEMLPSGYTRVIVNRVGWAKAHMKEAGLIASVRRGYAKITGDGKALLKKNPPGIDLKLLTTFPAYREFQKRKKSETAAELNVPELTSTQMITPDEQIDASHAELHEALAAEILEQVLLFSDSRFEHLVVELLVAMGYGGSIADAGKAVGRRGDGGIDGVIKEDRLGLDVIVIQAKKWTNGIVGRPEVQAFVGSMEGYRASKGVFITTSTFSGPAVEYIQQIQRKIALIDGRLLANLMIEHGVGVTTYRAIQLKRLDMDYFQE